MKILVAEDDPLTRQGLVEIFTGEGYTVVTAKNGSEAIKQFDAKFPDLVCLDIMMPDMDGYEVCRRIRQKNEKIPILFISAKSEEIDKVLGLELGADDYIPKPFGAKEVLARVKAVSRRYKTQKKSGQITGESFVMLDLTIEPQKLKAYRDKKVIELSKREMDILTLLFEHQGQALSRDYIFDKCWGADYIPNSRTLDQQISQLRKKVEANARKPLIIKTVQGVGYRFEVAD